MIASLFNLILFLNTLWVETIILLDRMVDILQVFKEFKKNIKYHV